MNSSSWIQVVGVVVAVLSAGCSSYIAVRLAIGRVEAAIEGLRALISIEVKRVEELLQLEVSRLDELIQMGNRAREEHHQRLRFLEQRLMESRPTHIQ